MDETKKMREVQNSRDDNKKTNVKKITEESASSPFISICLKDETKIQYSTDKFNISGRTPDASSCNHSIPATQTSFYSFLSSQSSSNWSPSVKFD